MPARYSMIEEDRGGLWHATRRRRQRGNFCCTRRLELVPRSSNRVASSPCGSLSPCSSATATPNPSRAPHRAPARGQRSRDEGNSSTRSDPRRPAIRRRVRHPTPCPYPMRPRATPRSSGPTCRTIPSSSQLAGRPACNPSGSLSGWICAKSRQPLFEVHIRSLQDAPVREIYYSTWAQPRAMSSTWTSIWMRTFVVRGSGTLQGKTGSGSRRETDRVAHPVHGAQEFVDVGATQPTTFCAVRSCPGSSTGM